MLENLHLVWGLGWSLGTSSSLGSHICCICTVSGHSIPLSGIYYDRPVYSHHFSLELGLKGGVRDSLGMETESSKIKI